jgi:hypothetical protein
MLCRRFSAPFQNRWLSRGEPISALPDMTAMIGRRFGRLTVVCEAARMHRKRRWICVCSCGAQTTAYQWSLVAGRSRSCGCLKSEELRLKSAALNERRGNENHGMHGSAEYKCWLLMKNRCYNSNSKDYAYAGARGVRVCEAWRSSFQSFYDDMGKRPPGHFLQRIRATEEFGPGNCRWGRRRPGGRPKKGELDIEAAATEEVRDGTSELRTTFMQHRD